MSDHDEQHEEGQSGPTVRDRRRIDPETFQVREPQSAAAPAGSAAPAGDQAPAGAAGGNQQVEELQAQLSERTADLQRLQAESWRSGLAGFGLRAFIARRLGLNKIRLRCSGSGRR